jgi:NAD(P)H dehydrogenase (quinone)
MGKFLLLIAHPDPNGQSSSHRIAKAANDALLAAGNEVRIVDLIHTPFTNGATINDFLTPPPGRFAYESNQGVDNLIPAIREQQAILEWSTHVIVIGPIWFYRFPAYFYSWIDRVWAAGWAFAQGKKVEEGPLYGKKALFVITAGAPSGYYSHGGKCTSIEALFYSTTASFAWAGFTVYRSQGVWNASGIGDDQVAKVAQAIVKIEKRPILPFKNPAKPDDLDTVEVLARLPNIELDEAINF